ncbi:hypothetical protein K3495_g16565, partial [Podosphaera aphanis]
MPQSPDDPRLKEREFKLIKEEWMPEPIPPQTGVNGVSTTTEGTVIPRGDKLFVEEELQELWDQGVKKDAIEFGEVYEVVAKDKEDFPT